MKDLMDLMVESKLCTTEMFDVSEQIYSALVNGEQVPGSVLSTLDTTHDFLSEVASLERLNEIMNLVDEELPYLVNIQDANDLTGPQRELVKSFSLIHECSNIEGYTQLSLESRNLFCGIYKVHHAGHGIDFKDDWKAVYIKDCERFLKVTFKNGEWLHYYPDGTWS